MLDNRVFLTDLSVQLGYKDQRLKAVRRWCQKHRLEIFKAGKQYYVFRDHLDQAFAQTESHQRMAELIKTKTAMKTTSKISIPKEKKFESLFMTCSTCRRNYSSDDAVTCKHELKYKARVSIKKDGKYTNISKVLNATYYGAAVFELAEFKKSLRIDTGDDSNKGNSIRRVIPVTIELDADKAPSDTLLIDKRVTLADAIKSYLNYLNNIDVPLSEQKERSKANNDEAELILRKHFLAPLHAANISDQSLFTDINSDVVDIIFKHTMTVSNKYHNKIFSRLRSFATYVINHYNLHFKNPFLKVAPRSVRTNNLTITAKEFEQLLKIVTPDRGYISQRHNRTRSWFRPWLADAFKLGVLMGGRRDEIVYVRWSNLIWENKKPIGIKIENFKVNRIKGYTESDKIYSELPIGDDLLKLLKELGLNKRKDSNDYILAPNDPADRETMKDIISKGFSHYWQQLNTGKDLQFKNLRKTFKTSAIQQFGAAALAFWGGSDMSMEMKHYVNRTVLYEGVKGLKVLR